MLDALLPYYEKELSALRQQTQAFATQYPKIAAQLMLDGDSCDDPHVERMIESFAFLAARIHKKIDDDFPQISDALLSILLPHLLRPVPSMSIAQLTLPSNAQLTGTQHIPRGTSLLSRPVKGLPLRYRCAWPVEIAPIEVEHAFCSATSLTGEATLQDESTVICIRLAAIGQSQFSSLGLQSLRFYLDGESAVTHTLLELLRTSVTRISLHAPENAPKVTPVQLAPRHLQTLGLDTSEGLLDYDPRSFLGYRLLQECFTLPEKFLFVELQKLNLERFGKQLEIRFHLAPVSKPERLTRLEQAVQASTFRLHCTPIVNLFKQQAEPIRITQEVHEYPVIPDVRRPMGLEVYSIDSVHRLRRTHGGAETVAYAPVFAVGQAKDDPQHADDVDVCWMAQRSPSPHAHDNGTEMQIALVDRRLDPRVPQADTLSISLTCTNRDLPAHLPFGGSDSMLQLEEGGAIASAKLLKKPTAPSRAALRNANLWKLLSHLSLNHFSIIDGGREALIDILNLYNFDGSASLRKQINGIVEVHSEPGLLLMGKAPRQAFVRGTEITITFDEDQYVGSGVMAFAQVLDVFFGMYCTANSWTRLTVNSRQREQAIVVFAARSGAQKLV